jgi:hypothetical protein
VPRRLWRRGGPDRVAASPHGGPAEEALQLLGAFHAKMLFTGSGHGWRMSEVEELDTYELVEPNEWICVLLDLDDGQVAGTLRHLSSSGSIPNETFRRHEELWVVIGRGRPQPSALSADGFQTRSPCPRLPPIFHAGYTLSYMLAP